jgi:hypothetical protein
MARINQVLDENHLRMEYDSIEDFASVAAPLVEERYHMGMRTPLDDTHFYGDTGTVGAAFVMARDGWDAHLQDTLDIARSAVETVEQEHDTLSFQPEWQVSGGMVDMGAYLAGEPECMIEFPPAKTTRVGRVITLCASISLSSSVSAEQLILKGKVITALALELERLGINVELIADQSVGSNISDKRMTQRVTVKSANDALDPARILYAYAHPSMLRVIALCNYHAMPAEWQDAMGTGVGYGRPCAPPQDLPEGTMYLPETFSGTDVDAAGLLTGYLTELGLL